MRPRILLVSMAALLLGALFAAPAAANPEWHSEQPLAAGIGVQVPLGEVGQISCWQANRCLLITAGNTGMPAGLYAYDGTGWHLYSTVCGGHNGRIAWAGPDEFWTISDFQAGQAGVISSLTWHRSLCHFVNGGVVASYAEPVGSVGEYQQMSAAACAGPNDCWFAGERLPGNPNSGAFHLHWDGNTLSAVPSLTEAQPQVANLPGAVTDLAFAQGHLYEAASAAPFLHEVQVGEPEVFLPLTLPSGPAGPFRFAGDGSQLWAVNASGGVLRLGASGFDAVTLSSSPGAVTAFAVEPGGESAWVGGSGAANAASVTRIEASGAVGMKVTLPAAGEGLNSYGPAAALACPAAGQCWMATSKGWLFHLGGPPPQDTDPAMHQLITFRPCGETDQTCPSGVETGLPEDNSGSEVEAPESPSLELEKLPHHRKPRALVAKVSQKMLDGTLLQLAFTLRARAHVQLLAKRHKRVVAKTPKLTLGRGRHKLRLRLDPKLWPTKLDFEVHVAGSKR